MKLTVNNPTKNNSAATPNYNKALSDVLNETLANKGIDSDSNCWQNDNTLEADNIPQLALHTFLLKAEQLGKSYTMERKLTITFNED
jgi:hypothetical protein